MRKLTLTNELGTIHPRESLDFMWEAYWNYQHGKLGVNRLWKIMRAKGIWKIVKKMIGNRNRIFWTMEKVKLASTQSEKLNQGNIQTIHASGSDDDSDIDAVGCR